MTIFAFDYDTFIVAFPAFSNATNFPEALLSMNWDAATAYMTNNDAGSCLNGTSRNYALNLLTAHISWIGLGGGTGAIVPSGQTPYILAGAGIDKVNISLKPPPGESQFRWWLNTTAYGQSLLALLDMLSCGGFDAGGLPETAAIRKVGGVF